MKVPPPMFGQEISMRRRVLLSRADVVLDVIVEGAGLPIILLPSLGRDSEDYEAVAVELAKRNFKVLRPQPRGLGRSVGPMQDLTLADFAADVACVIDNLVEGRAIILGHAFGNWIARMAASLYPEKILGVIIAAAAAKQYPSYLTENIRKIMDVSTPQDERLAYLRATFFAPGNDPSIWLDGWHPDVRVSQLAAVRATPQELWWGAGHAPLLDLQAAQDPFKPEDKRSELVQEFGARVSIALVENASHALIPEQPAQVVDAIAAWVASRAMDG